MAPESINFRRFTTASDVWMFGNIRFFLILQLVLSTFFFRSLCLGDSHVRCKAVSRCKKLRCHWNAWKRRTLTSSPRLSSRSLLNFNEGKNIERPLKFLLIFDLVLELNEFAFRVTFRVGLTNHRRGHLLITCRFSFRNFCKPKTVRHSINQERKQNPCQGFCHGVSSNHFLYLKSPK